MSNIITKNQTAEIPTKSGNKYSYQYVDIAQIHEYLEENNMSYYQYIDRIDNDDYIMTVKIIDGVEQKPLRGSRVVDATLFGNDNPAQKQGSALTYARRYSLLMAFGLATEDDDANELNIIKEVSEEEAYNYTLSFGKHKGKKINELPKEYIDWLIDNSKDERLLKMIEIVTGEKIPTEEEQKEINKLIIENSNMMFEQGTDREEMMKYFKVESDSEMTLDQLRELNKILKGRKK